MCIPVANISICFAYILIIGIILVSFVSVYRLILVFVLSAGEGGANEEGDQNDDFNNQFEMNKR